jgi:hypothetical protein
VTKELEFGSEKWCKVLVRYSTLTTGRGRGRGVATQKCIIQQKAPKILEWTIHGCMQTLVLSTQPSGGLHEPVI